MFKLSFDIFLGYESGFNAHYVCFTIVASSNRSQALCRVDNALSTVISAFWRRLHALNQTERCFLYFRRSLRCPPFRQHSPRRRCRRFRRRQPVVFYIIQKKHITEQYQQHTIIKHTMPRKSGRGGTQTSTNRKLFLCYTRRVLTILFCRVPYRPTCDHVNTFIYIRETLTCGVYALIPVFIRKTQPTDWRAPGWCFVRVMLPTKNQAHACVYNTTILVGQFSFD